jgi:hypothetical protein
MPQSVSANPTIAKRFFTLEKGKIKGTVVTQYQVGEERPYLIEHYGGRLVAEGMSEEDIDGILLMQSVLMNILNEAIKSNPDGVDRVIKELSLKKVT